VIGEIAKRLPDQLLAAHPQVPWKQVKGFRDFLIRQYDRVDIEAVWQAVIQLPELRNAVDVMLRSVSDEDMS
jgi:uncharacterized protein with HEPN domain